MYLTWNYVIPPAYGVWREGNVFTLCVCPQGAPRSRSRSRLRGPPGQGLAGPPRSRSRSRGPPGQGPGGPPWSRSRSGAPRSRSGGPHGQGLGAPPGHGPGQGLDGPPRSRSRGPPPGQGLGPPLSRSKNVGAWAVRLLRSRKRTVLLLKIIL